MDVHTKDVSKNFQLIRALVEQVQSKNFKVEQSQVPNAYVFFQKHEIENLIDTYNNLKEEDDEFKQIETIILKNRHFQSYFVNHLDVYVHFIGLKLDRINTLSDWFQLLKHENVFPKNITESSAFQILFVENLLVHLSKLVHRLNGDQSLIQEISKLIEKCIFKKTMSHFEEYVNAAFTFTTQKPIHRFPKLIVKLLKQAYGQPYDWCLFKIVIGALINADFQLIYKFLILCCEMLGYDMVKIFSMEGVSSVKNNLNPLQSQEILIAIFDQLRTIKISNECTINDIGFNEFLKDFVTSLIGISSQPNGNLYKLIRNITDINPLIIEELIDDLLCYCLWSDNSDCQEQFEQLFDKILDVFFKLRKFDGLLTTIINATKSAPGSKVERIVKYQFKGTIQMDCNAIEHRSNVSLPWPCIRKYSTKITILPSWQTIGMLKSLIIHFESAVNQMNSSKKKSTLYQHIGITASLLAWFLSCIRMNDLLQKNQTLMEFIQNSKNLNKSLKLLSESVIHSKFNSNLWNPFLTIYSVWMDTFLTLKYYSTKLILQTEIPDNNMLLTDDQWSHIFKKAITHDEIKELTLNILILRMKTESLQQCEIGEDNIKAFASILLSNNANIKNLLNDNFVANHILPKINSIDLLTLAQNIIDENIIQSNASNVLCGVLINTLCIRLKEVLKQKRKKSEQDLKMCTYIKALRSLPDNIFLEEPIDPNHIQTIAKFFNDSQNQSIQIDLGINETEIKNYLTQLKELIMLYNDKNGQQLLLILVLLLHIDLCNSTVSQLKTPCEAVIIGLLRFKEVHITKTIRIQRLTKMVVETFRESDEVFLLMLENICRNDDVIEYVQPLIETLIKYLKNTLYLRHAVTISNFIYKKKKQLRSDIKNSLWDLRQMLLDEMLVIVLNTEVKHDMILPYSCVLNNYVLNGAQNKENSADMLKNLKLYADFVVKNFSEIPSETALLFFKIIVTYKTQLPPLELSIASIWNCCKTFDPNDEQFRHLLTKLVNHSQDEEFTFILHDLQNSTEQQIDEQMFTNVSQILKIWTPISSNYNNGTKMKILQNQLIHLFHKLLHAIANENWIEVLPNLIQLIIEIIQSKSLLLSSEMIDILLIIPAILLESLPDFKISFTVSVTILENLLKYRSPLILDRLPCYLLQYRLLLFALCKNCVKRTKICVSDMSAFSDSAYLLEKLTKNVVFYDKDVSRLSPYIIADILKYYEGVNVYPNIKIHVDNCLYSFISLCDEHAVSYLMRVLNGAHRETFKILYENYKKFYRFTGKS